jgi:hypothetical protein
MEVILRAVPGAAAALYSEISVLLEALNRSPDGTLA